MPPDHQKFLTALPHGAVREATRLGLELARGLDASTWSKLVSRIAQLAGGLSRQRDTLTAWLGDVLAFGAGKYHGQIAEYARAAGISPGTLRDAKLVCTRIPLGSRHEKLSWSHHCEIGKAFTALPEIKRWLALAAEEQLSTAALRRRIRDHLSQSRAAPNTVDVPTFRLMRELRALDRMLGSERKLWHEWPAEARRSALAELNALVEFVTVLNAPTSALNAAS